MFRNQTNLSHNFSFCGIIAREFYFKTSLISVSQVYAHINRFGLTGEENSMKPVSCINLNVFPAKRTTSGTLNATVIVSIHREVLISIKPFVI